MGVIQDVHRERVDLARVLKKHAGIRRIVEDLYPDSAHFIYELLQNAEDTGATEVRFTLSKSKLVFEHNGSPFKPQDILAITDIGEGTKAGDDDKIGRFGVGFKAVFAYSETPLIWSPTYSFKISDLVLPSELNPPPDLGSKTRFEFPFNNPKKPTETAFAEIEAGLKELAETTLLFLTHLDSISWQIKETQAGEVLRIQHSENHFEVLKQFGGQTTTALHFLKFDQTVDGLQAQRIAIAFTLDFLPNVQSFDAQKEIAKQLKIISAAPGRVAVFFPAEKETSGLRFHLHAPFVPELSRASIKETPANRPLFLQLAALATTSLHKIRDLGLLSVEFLGVLPNPQDPLPPRYAGIRTAIVEEMNTQALTPTQNRAHAPAKRLIQGKASLKELLSDDDIEFLVDYEGDPPLWSMAAGQKNSNADRFLAGLAISDWDIDEFVSLLLEKASEESRYVPAKSQVLSAPDPDFLVWLRNKSIDWHQQFYALLDRELASQSGPSKLRPTRIVRLSDGHYSTGRRCFFPTEDIAHDKILPRVDSAIYTSGKSKSQQENAKKFLEAIGVREVGEAEQVEAILNLRYTEKAAIPSGSIHKSDMSKFISLIEKGPGAGLIFLKYFIFECADKKWRKPTEIFLDKPYVGTALRSYYEAAGEAASRFALSNRYQSMGLDTEKLAQFARTVGAATTLEIKKVSCVGNPNVRYLVYQAPGRPSHHEHNEDYAIPDLDKYLKNNSIELSSLVWRTISTTIVPWTEAKYCRNYSQPYRCAPSQLCALLKQMEWIPQTDGRFVRPASASGKLLPAGFTIDRSWPWLAKIGFEEEESIRIVENQKLVAEAKKEEERAKELGFADLASLKTAQRIAALPADKLERLIALASQEPVELPDHEPANPEYRAQRVGAQAAEAPGRQTEIRSRSVSVGVADVKQEADQYLRQQYTNSDGHMICQICKDKLPFRLDDDQYYFEAVELIGTLNKRHHQNYLSLCPNHAAMFMHANGSRGLFPGMLANSAQNQIDVVLAQQDASIYFTRTHLADLKTIIGIEDEESEECRA